jgi:hypothetical protein
MATAIFDVKHWLDGNSVHLMMATRPFQNGGKLISELPPVLATSAIRSKTEQQTATGAMVSPST